MARVGCR